jgi:hypothetical protein
MTKIKIKVTKEVLEQSKKCPSIINGVTFVGDESTTLATNCAFAIAVRDLFPNAMVGYSSIMPFEMADEGHLGKSIPLTIEMRNFIKVFDSTPQNDRVNIPEQEFELEIPDDVLELTVGKDEIDQLLKESKTLEICY